MIFFYYRTNANYSNTKNKISLLGYFFFEKETLKHVTNYLAKKIKAASDKNFNRDTEVQSIIQ